MARRKKGELGQPKRLQMPEHRRWWQLEGTALASQVATICRTLRDNDSVRRARYTAALSRYEGRPVSLDDDAYYLPSLTAPVAPLYNLVRSACDTVKADIAARQKPLPMFLGSGADWRTKRRAKKLSKFVEAQLYQPQGCYADSWQVMLDVFHDSAKMGVGVGKVSCDMDRRKVALDKVFPWELFVDPREARNRDPQNLFHAYTMEEDLAVSTFVEMGADGEPKDDAERAKLAAIQTAPRPRETSGGRRVVDTIMVYEAWRLPINEDKPGRHAICVDGAILFEEEYTAPEFPFIFLWWERDSVGFWAQGVAEAHGNQHDEVGAATGALQRRIAICSTKRTYYNPDAVSQAHMAEGGEAEVLIPCRDMTQLPQEAPTSPATSQEFQWIGDNIERFYSMSGVSQQQAAARKDPGLTAAVAIEAVNDIATVRFLPKAKGYEAAFVTIARLFVRAADQVAENAGGYLVRWPGKRFNDSLDWRDVNLSEDLYDIRPAATSAFAKDPAAQLQMATDLHNGGVINRETFLQMIEMPDIEGVLTRETAEREYLEGLFDRFLDSETEADLDEVGGYEAPEPFLANKPAAMWLAVATYWQAKLDQAPEFCLTLLRDWISQLDALVKPPPAPPGPTPAPMPGQAGPPQLQAVPEAPGALPAGIQPPFRAAG